MGVILLLLVSTLIIGCVGSNEQKTEPTVVPTTTGPTVAPTIGTQNVLTYIFKVGVEKMMLDKDIQLKELATEEGTALINVDGVPYKLTYNIEQEIKGRLIKITDLDGINETVKIMVR
jgi:hypothetical protein